jgi:hypothetical protein
MMLKSTQKLGQKVTKEKPATIKKNNIEDITNDHSGRKQGIISR